MVVPVKMRISSFIIVGSLLKSSKKLLLRMTNVRKQWAEEKVDWRLALALRRQCGALAHCAYNDDWSKLKIYFSTSNSIKLVLYPAV
uniref:Uncharacterized protein n=1 Tax=Glossina pallidipes TaxID=7398 RepID=A0A1A9Z2Z2_GLOPL